jgi:hypothetical protein
MAMRLLILLTCLAVSPAWGAACKAQSGPRTAALVELYTSEGCSSCPPADHWLSGLGEKGYTPDRVVPLALHVDYWDYIGWKDPYAKRAFSTRQRKLTVLQRQALVYTPQVMLQGRDYRGWYEPGFDEAVAKINAQPARAKISLEIRSMQAGKIEVAVSAALAATGQADEPALYLAAYQNRLQSQVIAGENGGRTLKHDFVALEWEGPVAFDPAGRLEERRVLPMVPKAGKGDSGVAAFVQNRRNGAVLQALMLPGC